jgi:hypothetical protein
MSGWFVYGIIVFGNLGSACAIVSVLSSIGIIILSIFWKVFNSECDERLAAGVAKWIRGLIVTLLICIVMAIFIPSTKELAAIYLIPKIVNNEQVQQVPDAALKLLNLKMEEWIKDTVGEGEK